jgi:hypothetical protein
MLGTKDLMPVKVPVKQIEGGSERAVLVIGADQVLGGGVIDGGDDGGKGVAIIECWAVSDLTVGHWYALVQPDGAIILAVHPSVAGAVRATMERFHMDGVQRIASESMRRQGVLEAIQAISNASSNALLQVAAKGGSHAHGSGSG